MVNEKIRMRTAKRIAGQEISQHTREVEKKEEAKHSWNKISSDPEQILNALID